jgi:hypothetical protein
LSARASAPIVSSMQHPPDPTPDAAAIREAISALPFELRDITRALVRALQTDEPPYQLLRAAVARYATRANRIGRSRAQVLTAVEEITLLFGTPRFVLEEQRTEFRALVLEWTQAALMRAD